MSVGACQYQERALGPLEMELQAVGSYCECWGLNAGPLKHSKLLSCLSSHLSKFFWNSK